MRTAIPSRPVPCWTGADSRSENPEWLAGDQALYLGAGALLIGGGVAAAVATTGSSSNNGGVGGAGSPQQNQLLYSLLLNSSNKNPASP
jgi:hypothetical protein